MKKRFLSIFLAAVMLVSLVPITASATETHNHEVNGIEAWTAWGDQGGETTTSLPTEAGSYYLTTDVELSETWTVPTDETNLCLNGHVIKMNGSGSVISVPNNATLNLYDCVGTGKITGGNATNGGGVFISLGGTFIMNGGNIVGNTADNGGGVSNSGTFTMSGGTITGNTAQNGGGIYASSITGSESVNTLVGGNITGNTATENGGGVYVKEEECFAAGTPITMADGSRKPIETLKIGDLVRVFDHENGEVSTAKLFDLWKYPEKHSDAVTLHFSNEIDITVVYGHSFFDKAANKYVAVTKDNVNFYVGHEFYNVDDGRWEKLIGYDFLDGAVDTYVITSEKHLNCVANGMLTNEDGLYTTLTNVFEYGDGLKIDAEKKANDLERYGLFGYEELQYVSREVYDILNLQYLNVAFGKGMITKDAFLSLGAYWAEVDPELLCGTAVQQCINEAGETCFLATAKSVQNDSPASPGVYLGGTIKITDNKVDGVENNLYLPSGKTVTLGTEAAAPADGMNIGVSMATAGAFVTSGGTADNAKYFFADDSNYYVAVDESALKLAETAVEDKYEVWVAGTQITAHNKDDVLHDGGKVKYDNATKTLTLNGATIAAGAQDKNLYGIYSKLDALTVELRGTNTIGRAADWELTKPRYSDYAVAVGINAVDEYSDFYGDLTFKGDSGSSLTIYDYEAGIEAGNVTFGTDFKGKLNVYDYGKRANCAINAGRWEYDSEKDKDVCVEGGDVTINGGTFDLTSHKSNCIHANNVTVKNATVKINAGEKGIEAEEDQAEGTGNITIENAMVEITVENVENKSNIYGIDADSVLTIDSSTVTAKATQADKDRGAYGISCESGTIEISGSATYVEATATGGDIAVGITGADIDVKNGTVKAKAAEGDEYTFALVAMSSLTIADTLDVKDANETYTAGTTTMLTGKDGGFVTIQPKQTPSGGGSSTITVPVTGDKDSVKISATVSGSNATIKNVTSEQLDKVGTGTEVTIDLSGLSKSVTGVTIPKTTFENVAASDADGLEVKLPNGTTAVFDKTTVAAVAEQAQGANIQLVVDKDTKAEKTLTNAQKETVKALNNPVVLDAYFVSNGTRISDFKGGEAELTAEYPTTSPVRVWYVKDDGTKELVPSSFNGKTATFTVKHFSHYVIEQLDGSSYAACPQDNTCVYAKFTDADAKAWYHDGVHYCVENGMMNGVSATQFAPNGTLTRGMVVTVLARLSGETVTSTGDKWYADGQAWAVANGVSDGTNMTANITREQLATMLYRYAVLKGIDTNKFTENTNTLSYTDVFTISDWATSGMHFCIAAGVVNGDNGMLYPTNTATRAEAAAMFQRLGEKVLAK